MGTLLCRILTLTILHVGGRSILPYLAFDYIAGGIFNAVVFLSKLFLKFLRIVEDTHFYSLMHVCISILLICNFFVEKRINKDP